MKKPLLIIRNFVILVALSSIFVEQYGVVHASDSSLQYSYWFLLYRKANIEILYKGVSGDVGTSVPVSVFKVKTGTPNERPTPLPQLFGRIFWLVIAKEATDNPETGPYFLTLDIPGTETFPFGPRPYLECNGQCNWSVPGAFGLHGVGGDATRLAVSNPGSSGCIRHADTDIAFLYQLLDPQAHPIRYYVEK